jgi:hypothetical protein
VPTAGHILVRCRTKVSSACPTVWEITIYLVLLLFRLSCLFLARSPSASGSMQCGHKRCYRRCTFCEVCVVSFGFRFSVATCFCVSISLLLTLCTDSCRRRAAAVAAIRSQALRSTSTARDNAVVPLFGSQGYSQPSITPSFTQSSNNDYSF